MSQKTPAPLIAQLRDRVRERAETLEEFSESSTVALLHEAADALSTLQARLETLEQEKAALREALGATTAMCRSATTWPADDSQGLRFHAQEQARIGMAALTKEKEKDTVTSGDQPLRSAASTDTKGSEQ